RLIALFAGAALAFACALPASQPPILDMTRVVVPPSDEGVEFGPFSFPTSTPTPPSPLRVDVLRVDRTHYRRMDPIVYDVRVTNGSSQTVMFPISPMPIAKKDR